MARLHRGGVVKFMQAVEAAMKGESTYPIQLNATDFKVFVTILKSLAAYSDVSHKEFETILGYGDGETEPISDWAMEKLSGIAESLGVEGV
jgi:hypothetical protein